jgi:hypothetical protein
MIVVILFGDNREEVCLAALFSKREGKAASRVVVQNAKLAVAGAGPSCDFPVLLMDEVRAPNGVLEAVLCVLRRKYIDIGVD